MFGMSFFYPIETIAFAEHQRITNMRERQEAAEREAEAREAETRRRQTASSQTFIKPDTRERILIIQPDGSLRVGTRLEDDSVPTDRQYGYLKP